jgi:hypothetical protein
MKLALEWTQAAKEGRAGRLMESQCRRVLSEIHEHANGDPLHFHTAGATALGCGRFQSGPAAREDAQPEIEARFGTRIFHEEVAVPRETATA